MKKKLLSLVLALLMVVALVPNIAMAATKYYVEIVPDYNYNYWYNDFVVYDSNGYLVNPYSGYNYYLEEGSYTVRGNIDGRTYSRSFYVKENGKIYLSDLDWYYGDGRYDYKYNGDISSISVYSNRVTGTAAPYANVVLYDANGSTNSTTADRNGNFSIYYNFDRYYDYKYNDYRYWYNLDNFYLRSNGGRSYYLSSSYLYDKYYDNNYAVITEAIGGEYYVAGNHFIPYSTVTVRDNQGNFLGSTDLDSKGSFAIRLNRALIAGETIKITTSNSRYADTTKSVVVSGVKEVKDNIVSKFTIGNKTYTKIVDGKTTTEQMDTEPFIQDGRTMLPIRYVAEALGYKVNWDEATKNAVFIKGSNTAVINLYSKEIFVNGKNNYLSVMPQTVNGRIMLPVSELGMALGLTHGNFGQGKNIEWDNSTRTVIISTYR